MAKRQGNKREKQIYDMMQDAAIVNKYETAIETILIEVEQIRKEISKDSSRDVIEFCSNRIKSPQSIIRKLDKKGYSVSAKQARDRLNDIAGVRIVCDYMDDIYTISRMLIEHDSFVLVKEKDFIRKPKKSGYRSLHLILAVPLMQSAQEELIRVEVQLRTVIMDFWARLDHKARYKQCEAIDEEVYTELNECALIGAVMDRKMLKTRKAIEGGREQSKN